MEYRQLGNSGVRVSVVGLGTNRFGYDEVPQETVSCILDAAIDLGINFIDTADVYAEGKSESTLGRAIKGRRDKFVLATKVWFPTGDGPNDRGASRYHIMNAVENSLRRLDTDSIDLYYIHRWDPSTPIEETLRALDDLVRVGKIRYLGASDFASWQMAHANLLARVSGWTPFVVLQSQYHLLERRVESDILPYCRAHGIGFIPYYPLAGGFLTGKYRGAAAIPEDSRAGINMESRDSMTQRMVAHIREYMHTRNFDLLGALSDWAGGYGRSLVELALAWLISQNEVCSVIPGATKVEHLVKNARAAQWKLDGDQIEDVNAMISASDTVQSC